MTESPPWPLDWPQVSTYAQRRDGVWNLFILCPFCGDRHEHGGGNDATPGLGSRLSHCSHGTQRSEYVLVPGPKGMEKPPAQTRGWRLRQWRASLDSKPPAPPVAGLKARRLYRALLDRGFYLRVGEGDELIVSPCTRLSPHDCVELRRHKAHLVLLLNEGPTR